MSIADLSDDRIGGSRGPERTPPHDMLAEQSTLGGMLLSGDAVADVIEALRGTDFYVPKHELIFEAVLSLYSHGEPTDVVAVYLRSGEDSDQDGLPDWYEWQQFGSLGQTGGGDGDGDGWSNAVELYRGTPPGLANRPSDGGIA